MKMVIFFFQAVDIDKEPVCFVCVQGHFAYLN